MPQHLPTQMRVAVARRRVDDGRGQSPTQETPWNTPRPGADSAENAQAPSLRTWKAQAEEEYVRRVMAISAGDVRRAASVAGISRGHWYELLKKYRI